jgi:muramidase (phage lysozyme)
MSGRAALAALALTGAGFLWWRQSKAAAGQAGQGGIAEPAPLDPSEWLRQQSGGSIETLSSLQGGQGNQTANGGTMAFNFAPLFQWGVDRLAGLFGGGSGSSISTPNAGGAGSSTGGTGGGVPVSLPSAPGGSTGTGGGFVGGLLDLIGQAEAPAGYNQVYGGSRLQPPRPITTMTVSEVLDWQDRSVAAGSASSAAGRYQIIRGTLRDLVGRGVLSPSETFDADAQDRAAVALMERRGLRQYQAGSLSAEAFGQRLSQEWAGLPAMTRDRRGRTASGQSYYAGDGLNRATVSRDRVLSVLRSAGGFV